MECSVPYTHIHINKMLCRQFTSMYVFVNQWVGRTVAKLKTRVGGSWNCEAETLHVMPPEWRLVHDGVCFDNALLFTVGESAHSGLTDDHIQQNSYVWEMHVTGILKHIPLHVNIRHVDCTGVRYFDFLDLLAHSAGVCILMNCLLPDVYI